MPRISKGLPLITALALASGSGAAAEKGAERAAVRQDFIVGADSLTMPVPEGYCIPEGKLIDEARLAASVDQTNVTLATFYACDGEGTRPFQNYVLLKAPKTALLRRLEKASALDSFEATMLSPQAPKLNDTQDSATRIGKVVGRKTSLKGNFRYLGRDADCIYMGSEVSLSMGEVSGDGLAVACITVAATKVLSVNVYTRDTAAGLAGLKVKARSIALTIGAAPPAK